MNNNLEKKLFSDFNELFENVAPNWPINLFGCECADGWEPLIRRLCERLKGKGITVFQIKEKFGGLRFYIQPTKEDVHDEIRNAENESFSTCEECGSKEDVTTAGKGWIRTLCPSCRTKWEHRKF